MASAQVDLPVYAKYNRQRAQGAYVLPKPGRENHQSSIQGTKPTSSALQKRSHVPSLEAPKRLNTHRYRMKKSAGLIHKKLPLPLFQNMLDLLTARASHVTSTANVKIPISAARTIYPQISP